MNSNTPRTDAKMSGGMFGNVLVSTDFARTLELEIMALESRVKELEQDKDRLDWLLGNASIVFDGSYIDTRPEADMAIEHHKYNE